MGITGLIFLSSGLFLGWSLGANDASNIFGTAVGTKMVKFNTAAVIASVFVILGAVAFCADKEMPLYGQLVDKIYGAVSKTGVSSGTFSGAASAGTEQNSGTDEK